MAKVDAPNPNGMKYYLISSAQLDAIGSKVQELSLKEGMQIWGQLLHIAQNNEFNGPLPDLEEGKKKKGPKVKKKKN